MNDLICLSTIKESQFAKVSLFDLPHLLPMKTLMEGDIPFSLIFAGDFYSDLVYKFKNIIGRTDFFIS